MNRILLLLVLSGIPALSYGGLLTAIRQRLTQMTTQSAKNPKASSGVVTSCTWLQNVGTDRFSVMCETKSILDDLQLQYWPQGDSGAAKTCKFTYRPTLLSKWIAVARVSVPGQEGGTFEYQVLSKGVPVSREDAKGSVRLWRSGAEDGDFTAVIWGDNQAGTKSGLWDKDVYAFATGAFSHMRSRNPDFGISTGDMSDAGNYKKEISPLLLERTNPILGHDIPYFVVWGNHDRIPLTGLHTRQYFDIPVDSAYKGVIADNYFFYRGDVLFIFVDEFCFWTPTGILKARKWVEKVLATPEAQAAKFRIVVQHSPVYLETHTAWETKAALKDVYSRGLVDLVLSGHMHGCEHIEVEGGSFIQLTNGGFGELNASAKVVEDYGRQTKIGGHRGIPYLWARQDDGDPSRLGEPQPVSRGFISGYSEMNVEGDRLTFAFHGLNADGSYIGIFDKFTLTARQPGETGILVHSHPDVEVPADAPTAASLGVSYADAPVTKAAWYLFETEVLGRDVSAPSAAEENEPATGMSRKEAEAYAAWLGDYRLPTVAELSGATFYGVAEWTSDDDATEGWCRIANCAVGFIATPSCTANYLGFRLVK